MEQYAKFLAENVKKYVQWKWMLQIIPENVRMARNVFFVLNVLRIVRWMHYNFPLTAIEV